MLIDIHNAARAITDSIQSIESITAEGQLIELGILSKVWMDGWMDGWQDAPITHPGAPQNLAKPPAALMSYS
jgi:hypothetical protein